MFDGSPPVPPVPVWDQLDRAAIEADCFPSEPGPDDPVFDFSDDILEDLSVEDKWMLLPPSARWAVVELPKELRKPDRDTKTDKKKSKWAQSSMAFTISAAVSIGRICRLWQATRPSQCLVPRAARNKQPKQ